MRWAMDQWLFPPTPGLNHPIGLLSPRACTAYIAFLPDHRDRGSSPVLSEPRPDASRADDRAGSQLVVRVDGELDLFTGDALAQRLTALVAQRPREVVLDVSALTFCDSSGLAVLVNAEQAAKAQGVRIVL